MNSYLIVLAGLIAFQPISSYAESKVDSNVAQLVLTPLSAKFETIDCARPCQQPSKSTWWMWRTPTHVEFKKANSNNSEFWTWDNGNANYQFLMHDEKKLIEYSQIDLKMLDIAADNAKWQAVTSLVSQKDLAGMKKTSLKEQYKGLALTQYNGDINGVKTDIVWIAALQIPLQMTYVYPQHQVIINLLNPNVHTANAMATSEQALLGYQHIDYADIGDMEHSAQAKMWLSKAEDAPGISRHYH